MSTAFKQYTNNARATIATAPSPATSGTSLVVASGKGALFPAPGNGFWATIWNKTSFPDPTDDANMEIVLVTARSTDTFTITRAQQGTAARTVTTSDTIARFWTSTDVTDLTTAINNDETGKEWNIYDAVVAASGGDYTTLGAALAAGKGSIFVRRGTYTETTTALNTYTLTSKNLTIVGEDRDNTIIKFNNTTSSTFLLNYPTYAENITFQCPASTSLTTPAGWINMNSDNCHFYNCTFLGSNDTSTGFLFNHTNGAQYCWIKDSFFKNSSADGYITFTSANAFTINGCFMLSTRGTQIYSCNTGTGSSTYTEISNNTLQSSAADTPAIIFRVGGSNTGLSVINNKFIATASSNTGGSGGFLKINGKGGGSSINEAPVIANNYFDLTQGSSSVAMTSDGFWGMSFIGNTINQTATGNASASFAAIVLSNLKYSSVVGNAFNFTGTPATNVNAMQLGGANCTIEGNTIRGYSGTTNLGLDLATYNMTTSKIGNNECIGNTTNIKSTSITNGWTPAFNENDQTANYSLLDTDWFVTGSNASGMTLTLPTAVGLAGKIYTLKNIGATGTVTIATTSSQTIDGSTTYLLSTQYQAIQVISNNANWLIL